MSTYQRTADASPLFILLDGLYLFLPSEVEKNNILLGRISDQQNGKQETYLVVLLKSLPAECPDVAMNGASFNLPLSNSILFCLLMIPGFSYSSLLPVQHIWHNGFRAKENPITAERFSTSFWQCKLSCFHHDSLYSLHWKACES